ncbi:MAG: SAP domain-containing protein [Deltaproteobacteria bacterium]|nr:SAP domain-containing protein [Deltaproteobacteria bacterium]
MKFNEIQKMAKRMGVNTFQMKKTDMILAIQRAENNIKCYGTPRVEYCQEFACLWREDCLSLNIKD